MQVGVAQRVEDLGERRVDDAKVDRAAGGVEFFGHELHRTAPLVFMGCLARAIGHRQGVTRAEAEFDGDGKHASLLARRGSAVKGFRPAAGP